MYLTASTNAVPDALSHSPTSSSQALKPDSQPSTFRKHHDLLHQSVLSILSVWSISAVYQTPCLCSIGFSNRSDKSSDTAFRDESQRVIHLYAALQMCIAERLHGCQGDRISFDFASVHQLLRDCAALNRFHRTKAACPGLKSLSSSASRGSSTVGIQYRLRESTVLNKPAPLP